MLWLDHWNFFHLLLGFACHECRSKIDTLSALNFLTLSGSKPQTWRFQSWDPKVTVPTTPPIRFVLFDKSKEFGHAKEDMNLQPFPTHQKETIRQKRLKTFNKQQKKQPGKKQQQNIIVVFVQGTRTHISKKAEQLKVWSDVFFFLIFLLTIVKLLVLFCSFFHAWLHLLIVLSLLLQTLAHSMWIQREEWRKKVT
jgi:hypothetical protein